MKDFIEKLLAEPSCVVVEMDRINELLELLKREGFLLSGDIWMAPNNMCYIYLVPQKKVKFLSFYEISSGLGRKRVYKVPTDSWELI